jgi:tetratricopeptide (TPR) repeat protein
MTTRKHELRAALAGLLLLYIGGPTGLCWAQPSARPSAPPAADNSQAGPTALRKARNALIDAGDYQGALKPAQQVVKELDGTKDPQLPTDIATLARVQAELKDFDAAELNYLKAIDLIGKAEGQFSTSLIAPYEGLGRSYIRSREFDKAVTALEEARHLNQRSLGLFNVEQTPIIDDLTTAYLGLGDTVTAESLQQESLTDAVRRFGANSPKTIPFHYRLASYYSDSRLRSAAREQYETVVKLVENQDEANSTALLRPLRELLGIDLLLGGERDDERNRLLDILGSDSNLDPTERALSLAALGDWSTAKDDPATAKQYYSQAYELLRDTPGRSPDEAFGTPRMIDFVEPLSAVDRGESPRPYAWGTIELTFDVSADGRASHVAVANANPAHLMDTAYSQRIRETHFRPRVVNGEPVATGNVHFTQHFRYYVKK